METEQSYGCPDFYISVTTHTDNEHVYTMDPRQSLTYHVADVYLQDVTLLRTGCAGETFFERWTEATTVEMAERYNALLAVSGDYFIHHGDNFVLRNGELIWENHPKRDICVLYRDGSLETFGQKEYDEKEVLASDPWQIWSFGPSLLDKEGQPIASFLSDVTAPNPRCVLGYYEPGHYCFVVVDGRIDGYSDGISMEMLSKLMFDLGCVAAYNLDGGGTAHMQWRSEMYSRQRYSPRPLSDIIYIAYPAS